eukprot:SAG11_NODE_3322_length_2524_cov_4.138144_1_plen_248_part_00
MLERERHLRRVEPRDLLPASDPSSIKGEKPLHPNTLTPCAAHDPSAPRPPCEENLSGKLTGGGGGGAPPRGAGGPGGRAGPRPGPLGKKTRRDRWRGGGGGGSAHRRADGSSSGRTVPRIGPPGTKSRTRWSLVRDCAARAPRGTSSAARAPPSGAGGGSDSGDWGSAHLEREVQLRDERAADPPVDLALPAPQRVADHLPSLNQPPWGAEDPGSPCQLRGGSLVGRLTGGWSGPSPDAPRAIVLSA